MSDTGRRYNESVFQKEKAQRESKIKRRRAEKLRRKQNKLRIKKNGQ